MKVKVNDLTGETPEFTYVYSQFTQTVFAGSARELDVPMGVAVDGDGNVYVAEADGNKITKITPSGALSTLADNTGGQLIDPQRIAVDSKGNVYVSDYGDNKIKKITPSGAVTVFAGNAGEFNTLRGIAVDREDNVFIADYGNNKVKKITPSGMVSPFADFTAPNAITVDVDGNVYVAGPYQIKKITDGVASPFAGSIKGDDDMFDQITGIAVDKNGTVYVSDYHNFKIKKVTPLRSVSTIANMSHPQGIAVDKNGDLYIAISMGSSIIKIVQE
jgi:streptogramin lyase